MLTGVSRKFRQLVSAALALTIPTNASQHLFIWPSYVSIHHLL
jgi:hypothetical protein